MSMTLGIGVLECDLGKEVNGQNFNTSRMRPPRFGNAQRETLTWRMQALAGSLDFLPSFTACQLLELQSSLSQSRLSKGIKR